MHAIPRPAPRADPATTATFPSSVFMWIASVAIYDIMCHISLVLRSSFFVLRYSKMNYEERRTDNEERYACGPTSFDPSPASVPWSIDERSAREAPGSLRTHH